MREEVKQLLLQHNYVARLEQKSDMSCMVSFPQPLLTKPNLIQNDISYEIREGGLLINGEFWSCPIYAVRLMIICDIYYRMKRLGLESDLIIYTDKNNNVVENIYDVFPGPQEENEKQKESFLNTILKDSMADRFPSHYDDVAISHNVEHGFRLLKSFLK